MANQAQLDIILNAKNRTAGAFGQVTQALSKLGLTAGSIQSTIARTVGALSGAAVTHMTLAASEELEKMGRAAAAAGIAIEKFSAISFSGRINDLDDLSGGMKGFTRAMSEAASGRGAMASLFGAMKIDVNKVGGGLRDTATVLTEVSDKFASYADDANKATLSQQLFGKSGMEWVQWMNRGGAALLQDTERAKAFGVVVDTEMFRRAEAVAEAWRMVGEVFRGFKYSLVNEVGPALAVGLKFATGVDGPSIMVDQISTIVSQVLGLLSKLAVSVEILVQVGFEAMIQAVATGSNVLLALVSGDIATAQLLTKEAVSNMQKEALRARQAFNELWNLKPNAAQLEAQAGSRPSAPVNVATDFRRELESEKEFLALKERALQGGQAIVNSDWRHTDFEKRAQNIDLLTQEVRLYDAEIEKLGELRDAQLDDAARAQIDSQVSGLQNRRSAASARLMQLQESADPYRFVDQLQLKFELLKQSWGTMAQQMATTLTSTVTSAIQGVSNALANVIMGTQSLGQAFSQLALSMATQFIASVLQMVLIATVAIPVLTALGILSGGSTPAVGLTVTSAALASGASLSASYASHAAGGLIPGPSSDRDNQLSWLASGEYVARAAAVRYYGAGIFEALNSMRIPRDIMDSWRMPVRSVPRIAFAEGGLVGGMGQAVNVNPTPITIIQVRSHSELLDVLQTRQGQKVVLDLVKGSKSELGIRS